MYFRVQETAGDWWREYVSAWHGAVSYVREVWTPGILPRDLQLFEQGVMLLGLVCWGIATWWLVKQMRGR